MTIAAQSRPRCVLVSPAAVWVSRSGQIRGARWSVDDDSYESDFVVLDNVIVVGAKRLDQSRYVPYSLHDMCHAKNLKESC